MIFKETKTEVSNRGVPPDSFLTELVEWARMADASIFLPNAVPLDIYAVIRPTLGPWRLTDGEPAPYLFHRRAAMCEAMRVHAGLESSWNWNEGVDTTNKSSMANIEGQETGIFQVSHDSFNLDHEGVLTAWLATQLQDGLREDTATFIIEMKADHDLALEFYARLVRINTRWAGPLVSGAVTHCVRPYAVEEFQRLLA